MNNRKKLVQILAGLMAAIMLLSLILTLIPTSVSAASSSEIRKQLNKLKEEKKEITAQIDEVQGLYDANATEIDGLISQKNAIDQEITLLHSKIETTNAQITAYGQLIADTQDELEDAEAELRELSEAHRERVRIMEEEGSLTYWEVIFQANSFTDLLDRLNMIEELNASDRRRI